MLDVVDFVFDGKNHSVRPSFGILTMIESRIDRSIVSIIMNGKGKGITLQETAVAIHALLMEDGGDATFEQVGQHLLANNYAEYSAIVVTMLANALNAGPKKPVGDPEGGSKSDATDG